MKASVKKLPPIHPVEILRAEFMLPRDLSQNALARQEKEKQIARDVEPLAASFTKYKT